MAIPEDSESEPAKLLHEMNALLEEVEVKNSEEKKGMAAELDRLRKRVKMLESISCDKQPLVEIGAAVQLWQ